MSDLGVGDDGDDNDDVEDDDDDDDGDDVNDDENASPLSRPPSVPLNRRRYKT